MPWINKPKPNKTKNVNEKFLAQKYVYNTSRWHNLRNLKLRTNPLCENCLKNDKVAPAVEIHHINPFMNGTNIEQIKWLGFDYTNLESLCLECHQNKHTKNNNNLYE